ncbi:hypothetical protein P4B35_10200 [Pontiellaceae bacterium B12227]|nr:hypothetical protein [Pontiellaceae bacterium B12227]
MNSVQLSGTISRQPEVNDTGIHFMLKARYPVKGEPFPGTTLIPCVVFDYSPEQKNILLDSGLRKFRVEINGRIVKSVFENEYGEVVSGLEVVANPNGLLLQRMR